MVRCTSLFSFHQTLSIGVSALKINNKEFTILYVGDVIVRYFLSPFLQESWRHFLLIFVIKIRVCFVITVMYFDIFETSVGYRIFLLVSLEINTVSRRQDIDMFIAISGFSKRKKKVHVYLKEEIELGEGLVGVSFFFLNFVF